MRYRLIRCHIDRSDPVSRTAAYQAYLAVYAALPREEKGLLSSEWATRPPCSDGDAEDDGRSDRIRAAKSAVWRAYLDYFPTPRIAILLGDGDMAKARLLMAEFGMSFPDLPPPAFPDPVGHGIPEDVFWSFAIASRAPGDRSTAHRDPTAGERRRLAEFGAALTKVASWHAKSDTPGIPAHKLTIDASMEEHHRGWIIRDVECEAALRIWRSLSKRHGEAALMRRIAAELAPELWSGWLVHLGGLYVVGSLSAWTVLHRLRESPAGDAR